VPSVSQWDELSEYVDAQLSLTEENFLELPNEAQVEAYLSLLVDLGSRRGEYGDVNRERLVKVVMGDEYTVGQAGAVGPGSHAEHMTFVQTWNQIAGDVNLSELASELETLRQHLRATASDPEHDVAIAALAHAEMAAKEGDGPQALERLSALRRVAGAGKWVLGAATSIGTAVAAQALKTALGL